MSEVAAQDYAATMARRYFELKGGGQAKPAAKVSAKALRLGSPMPASSWQPDPVDPDGQPAVVTGGELKQYCQMILTLQRELADLRADNARLWDRLSWRGQRQP